MNTRKQYYRERYYRKRYGMSPEEVLAEKREAKRQKRREKYPDAYAQRRDEQLQRLYGITLADYFRMYEEQQGKCGICRKTSEKTLHVDHEHIEGYSDLPKNEKAKHVRGLLCSKCNTGLAACESAAFWGRCQMYLRYFSRTARP